MMSDSVKLFILKNIPSAAMVVFFVLFASIASVCYKISMLLILMKKKNRLSQLYSKYCDNSNFNVTKELRNKYIADSGLCNKIPTFLTIIFVTTY